MTRESARLKLRELLEPIREDAIEEFDGIPDFEDACRLLELEQGRSFDLLMILVEEAGFTRYTPLGFCFVDEDGAETATELIDEREERLAKSIDPRPDRHDRLPDRPGRQEADDVQGDPGRCEGEAP